MSYCIFKAYNCYPSMQKEQYYTHRSGLRHELIKPLSAQNISTTEVVLKSYLSVSPYARSSMSFSSSVIASNFSYMCFSKMR